MNAGARLTILTRIGFAARGLVYIVIALLVIRAGQPEDPRGALQHIGEGGGKTLLMLVAGGFLAYGLWRLSDALLNIERHPAGNKGARERLGAAGSGLVHLLLAWQAIKLIEGASSAGGGLNQPGQSIPGGWLGLAVAGALLIGIGVFQLVKAAKAPFLRHLEPQIAAQPWAKWMGRLGYASRGVIFLISGYFLLQAGYDGRTEESRGFEDALAWLDHPWDTLVALGLLCFGLYSLVEARFRVIHDVPVDGIARRAREELP